MNEEISKALEESIKKMTFIGRIRDKIRILFISGKEINKRRRILIKEGKPLFEKFYIKKDKNDIIDSLLINYFEERIMSLPRYCILDLHEQLQKIKNAKSDEARSFFLDMFISYLSLSYSLDRWFRGKVIAYIRTEKID